MAATTTAGAQVQNTASAPEPTISESFPEEEAFSDKDKIVTIAVENDSIGGGGTDQNYTSGVRLSYFDINADLPEWARSAAIGRARQRAQSSRKDVAHRPPRCPRATGSAAPASQAQPADWK